MATYRILSIDGGGIRGIIPTILMQNLSEKPELSGWLSKVDLIAGTSTGGLIALALAKGLDLQTIRDIYEKKGPEIFDDSWADDVHDLGKLIGADYKIANLENVLRSIFGTTSLAELPKRVLITSFDLDNDEAEGSRKWKPKLFHNFPNGDSDGERLAYKVGLYTAAAPTYFESVDGYIDGGVYANNPSMCALAQSQDYRIADHPPLNDVRLLSLGTGFSLNYIQGMRLDWGEAQWIGHLISLMLDGSLDIAHFQCERLLVDHYHRLAPVFPPKTRIDMDAVDRIPEMIAFATTQVNLDRTINWISDFWM